MIIDIFMQRTGKWGMDFLFEGKIGDEVKFLTLKEAGRPAKLMINHQEYIFSSKN